MSIFRKKFKSRLKTISIYSFSQILSFSSIFLLSFIVVRYHSSELWGKYAEVHIWSNFFLLFLSFGSQDFLLKSFSNSPKTIAQDWVNNFATRSLLLIPSYLIINFIPVFKESKHLIFILITLQFICQSYHVIILYNRDFKFNVVVQTFYNLFVIVLLLNSLPNLDIQKLIKLIIIAQLVKLSCYFTYYAKMFKAIKAKIQYNNIKQSIPFAIPMVVGTMRVKVDAYYGTYFFDLVTLSKYQIFISFLGLAQISSSFIISPFLKNLYRSKNELIVRLQKRMFLFGLPFALLAIIFMFFSIEFIYKLHFTIVQYFFAFIFMIPLLIHVLLINEYYKKNKQSDVAVLATILTVIQIILGYFLIQLWDLNGALFIKTLGQWSIVVMLWVWIKKRSFKRNLFQAIVSRLNRIK